MELHAVPDGPDGDQSPPGMVSIVVAVESTIAAIGPPEADAALVALTRKMAAVMDGMGDAQLAQMAGQTAPQLLKLLQELESRAAGRRAAQRPARPSGVAKVRAAHAASPAKRKRAG